MKTQDIWDAGGPAFPAQFWDERATGMTLRDYLAAHAPIPQKEMALEDHCAYRYRYADAMLEQRKC